MAPAEEILQLRSAIAGERFASDVRADIRILCCQGMGKAGRNKD